MFVDIEFVGDRRKPIATVRFPWNPVTVSEIKELAGRYGHGTKWYPEEKAWKLKPDALHDLAKRPDAQLSPSAQAVLEALRSEKIAQEKARHDRAERLVKVFNRIKDTELGNGMRLRPHQVEGVEKLLGVLGKGLLCDDMGVGKSLQGAALALVFQEACKTHTVILCPKSLIPDWELLTSQLGINAIAKNHHFSRIPEPDQMPDPFILLVDEAHMIRNWKSKQGKKYLDLAGAALAVLPMSGTLMPNYRPKELWIHLRAINHPLAGQREHFFKYFCDAKRDEWGWYDEGAKHMDELEKLLDPYKVQRSKEIVGLPPLTLVDTRVPPNDRLYRSYYRKRIEEIRERRRQKVAELELRDEGLSLAEKETMLNVDDLDVIWRMAASTCKMDTAVDLARTITEGGVSVIVSTFFVETAEQIAEQLGTRALSGKMPGHERDRLINSFKAGNIPVLVMTSVGGLGLNLQVAKAIIQVDRSWDPSKNDQMISRAHRTGQDREVTVYTLLYGEPDERMSQVLGQKLATADEIEAAREKLARQQYREFTNE